MNWIKCSEKMPEGYANAHSFLVVCYQAWVGIGYLDKKGVFLDEPYGMRIPATHWMPLPQPPEE